MGSSMVNDEQKPPLYGVRVSDEYKMVRTSDLPPQALGKGLIQDTSAHGISHIFNSRGRNPRNRIISKYFAYDIYRFCLLLL